MFEQYDTKINKQYADRKIIFDNQEQVFFNELGFYPDFNKRYFSIFRQDKHAGCRFITKNGIIYFVDNRKYNGQLMFNCIDTVMVRNNLNFFNAVQVITKRLGNTNIKVNKIISDYSDIEKYKAEIRFKYINWTNNNYFTREYNLPIDYLNRQPYYQVSEYWTNTKTNWKLRKNPFGIKPDMIAYYFSKTNHTKLYFPNQEYRFHSNCNNEDVFGMHRENLYLNNLDSIFICSSAKDEMILNYFTGVNTLGLQTEVIPTNNIECYLSDRLLNYLKYFRTVYVLFDNDEEGINSSKLLANYLNSININSQALFLRNYGNDIADVSKEYCLNKVLCQIIEEKRN